MSSYCSAFLFWMLLIILWTGHLTTGSDVYGFGAVLLEIMSGRRIIDSKQPTWEHNLIDFAKPYLNDKKRLPRIVDSRLEGKYPLEKAYEVAKICLRICVKHVGDINMQFTVSTASGKHCILGAEKCSEIEQWITPAIPTTKCLKASINYPINK